MTNQVSPEKLRKVMEQINLLLARADHPNTPPPEAELSRTRAERMMFLYRIEEASLDSESKAKMGIKPMKATWRVCTWNNEFADQYRSLVSTVVNHVDGLGVTRHEWDADGTGWAMVDVYGFESDLAYGEALWASIRLAFRSMLEPTLDERLSEAENVYRMRNAGMERIRIAEVMGYGTTGSATAKVTRIFKAACAERGEDAAVLLGKGNNVKQYRKSYSEAFSNTMWTRLYNLRTGRGQNSGEIVLANRKEECRELMYADYPHLRPKVMTPEEKAASDERIRKALAKARRRKPKPDRTNWAAHDRGAHAARTVDLGPVGDRRLPD